MMLMSVDGVVKFYFLRKNGAGRNFIPIRNIFAAEVTFLVRVICLDCLE